MINAIVAVDSNQGIGINNSLPWPHLHYDMLWFKNMTDGQYILMGRNTWDDPKMRKPLPDRINCVITNQPIACPQVRKFSGDYISHIKNLQQLYPQKNIFVIGGPKIIMECKDLIDYAYVTHRKGAAFSDVRIDLKAFMTGMRITSSRPSSDKMLNFSIYKNVDIFRPL